MREGILSFSDSLNIRGMLCKRLKLVKAEP
jgi:hypothetical protein